VFAAIVPASSRELKREGCEERQKLERHDQESLTALDLVAVSAFFAFTEIK
jgi:hypothetical protein